MSEQISRGSFHVGCWPGCRPLALAGLMRADLLVIGEGPRGSDISSCFDKTPEDYLAEVQSSEQSYWLGKLDATAPSPLESQPGGAASLKH